MLINLFYILLTGFLGICGSSLSNFNIFSCPDNRTIDFIDTEPRVINGKIDYSISGPNNRPNIGITSGLKNSTNLLLNRCLRHCCNNTLCTAFSLSDDSSKKNNTVVRTCQLLNCLKTDRSGGEDDSNGQNCTKIDKIRVIIDRRLKKTVKVEYVVPRKACMFGLKQCDHLNQNQRCYIEKDRLHTKRGYCACIENFLFDPGPNKCVKMVPKIDYSDSATNFTIKIRGPAKIVPFSDTTVFQAELKPDVLKDNYTFKFDWTLTASNNTTGIKYYGQRTANFHVTNLKPGRYVVNLSVFIANFDEPYANLTASHNFTVTAAHNNANELKAVIAPEHVETEENKKIILDGSGSKSENPNNKVVGWAWELVEEPENLHNEPNLHNLPSTAALNFDRLSPGDYTFKLTVKDDKNNEAVAFSTVLVREEIDYPPKAVAGSCNGNQPGDIQARLPVTTIFICGNWSSDDKGIEKWTWTRKDSVKITADIEGSTSPVLKISHVQAGDYTFTLEIEDKKMQKSSVDVHLAVLPAENKHPTAKAGSNVTIFYPDNSVILDGTQSLDDGFIARYLWTQISGPSESKMSNQNQARMTAADLIRGQYKFRLNVTDDTGLWSFDDVYVRVEESHNKPPIARAENLTVKLPAKFATLNGSPSYDDAGIVKWLWTITGDSPSGLVLLNNSRHSPFLLVTNFRRGVYKFNLTVCDKQNACDSTKVRLKVENGQSEKESIEFNLKMKLNEFTMKKQRKFVKQLSALLSSNEKWDEIDITVTSVDQDFSSDRIRITFYCDVAPNNVMAVKRNNVKKLLPALDVIRFLDSDSLDAQFFQDFRIESFNTKYCKIDCSGHGKCDNATKLCNCDRFWMPNFFKSRNPHQSNCDWSILYFVLSTLILISFAVGCLFWLICIFRKQRYLRRYRRGEQHRQLSVDGTGGYFQHYFLSSSKNRRFQKINGSSFMAKKLNFKQKLKGKNGYNKEMDYSDSDSLLSTENDNNDDDEEIVYDKQNFVNNQKNKQQQQQHEMITSSFQLVENNAVKA